MGQLGTGLVERLDGDPGAVHARPAASTSPRSDDKAFNEKSAQAKASTDRQAQAAIWQELNKEAMEKVWVVPTRFGRDQRLAGSKVGSSSGKDGRVYLWAPFGSWPYGDLYVRP